MDHARFFIVVAALAVFSPSALAGDAGKVGLERMLESQSGVVMALSDDPVLASFQRMLTHEPNRVAPSLPAGFERDPLIDALALPMLRWLTATRKSSTPRLSLAD